MDIPKSFWLHGQKIDVSYDDTLCAKDNERGTVYPGYNKIILQPSIKGEPQPASWIEQAFWHEAVHAILYHMESEKNDDEKFVNLFGNLLHQLLTTMEFSSKSKKK